MLVHPAWKTREGVGSSLSRPIYDLALFSPKTDLFPIQLMIFSHSVQQCVCVEKEIKKQRDRRISRERAREERLRRVGVQVSSSACGINRPVSRVGLYSSLEGKAFNFAASRFLVS